MEEIDYTDLFSDLELTINDGTNTIILKCHKIILYKKCVYFQKLLTLLKEKNLTEITINVPNAFVVYDIIMSFYDKETNYNNYPYWFHLLETIKCCDYLSLQPPSLPDNLVVSRENYPLLVDEIDSMGSDDKKLIKILIKNLPETYDISKIPQSLIDKMSEFEDSFIILAASTEKNPECIRIWNININTKIIPQFATLSCFSPDGSLFAYGNKNNGITIWNINTDTLVCELDYYLPEISHIFILSDNKTMVFISGGVATIKVWDIENEKLIHEPSNIDGDISAACITNDNKKLVAAYYNSNIIVWDLETGTKIRKIIGGDGGLIYTICTTFDNKQIITGNDDGLVNIWDLETGNIIWKLHAYNNYVEIICPSPDNKVFVTTGKEDIKIWDIKTGNLVMVLKNNHSKIIDQLCISPDGKRIITGSKDKISIWDLASGKLIDTINMQRKLLCMNVIPNKNKRFVRKSEN